MLRNKQGSALVEQEGDDVLVPMLDGEDQRRVAGRIPAIELHT